MNKGDIFKLKDFNGFFFRVRDLFDNGMIGVTVSEGKHESYSDNMVFSNRNYAITEENFVNDFVLVKEAADE